MESRAEELVTRLRSGERSALAELFSLHRPRLERLVLFRLPPRLLGRIDAEDVLQEAYLAATARLQHFLDSSCSFFVWLRLVVLQTLTDLQRKHLGAKMRDVYREVSLPGPALSQGTSASLAVQLLDSLTSPSQAVLRDETAGRLRDALESMNPIDREILALRHFEELSNQEVAEALSIEEKTASIRYVRALKRLKEILTDMSAL
jgi:RNA polymerase sigma-70 factor (ECF subfamily)